MKKLVSTALIVLVLVAAAAPAAFAAAPVSSGSLFQVTDVNGKPFSPKVAYAGQDYSLGTIGFKYVGTDAITVQGIDLVTSTDFAVFPFSITLSSYYKSSSIDNATKVATYQMDPLYCRGDAAQGNYILRFNVYYTTSSGEATTETVEMTISLVNLSSGGGNVDNIPKVIISSFSTNPSEVVAGEEFTLSVTFKNTAGALSATNIKAQLSADDGIFTPVSGSTTLFIDALAPNASATKSIRLKVKADAAPGSYAASFALNFDVAGVKDPIVDTEVLSIPVTQAPRAQVSKMQVSPTEATLGREINVMTSVNNTGKSTLFNVNVTFSDPNGVLGEAEQFVGNINAGASGTVDVYVPTIAAGEGNLTMKVTYEDENGTPYTYEESVTVLVMESGGQENPIPMPEPETNGLGAGWIILIIVAVLAAGAGAFLLIRRRKREQLSANNDREMVDELEQQYLYALDEQAESVENTEARPDETGFEDTTRELELPDSRNGDK